MKLITITLFLASMNLLFSQTTISAGYVSGTWNLAGSPYLIEGEITVQDGQTLNIDPGCLIEFQGHYKFRVEGRLLAIGTEQDTIRFTVADTTGFHLPEVPNGGWHSLRFTYSNAANDSTKLVFCYFEYGKAILNGTWNDDNGGAICMYSDSKVHVSNCTFSNNFASNYGGAIYLTDGFLKLKDSRIINNITDQGYSEWSQPALQINSGHSWIDNLIISNNQCSGMSISGSQLSYLYNITAHQNYGFGIYLGNNSVIQNSKITNNQSDGIYITNNSPKIINSLTCNNQGNGIYILEEGYDRILPELYNCTIGNNGSYGIYSLHISYDNNYTRTNNNNYDINNYTNRNCVIGKNLIISGNQSGSIRLINSQADVSYCSFSDFIPEYAGVNCLAGNPCFNEPTAGAGSIFNALEADWSLLSSSNCINHGTPDTTGLYLPEFDLAGNPRVFQGIEPRIDIGSYEFQGEPDQNPDIYAYPRNFDFYLCSIDSFSLEKSFTISNIGFADLEIASIIAPECFLIKRENNTEFVSAIEQFTINADSPETINIVFHPNLEYTYSNNIIITSNDPDENIVMIGVTGIGDIYPVVYENITEDTVWDSDIIKVVDSFNIEVGCNLQINAGTIVTFLGDYGIYVYGSIDALGSIQDSIIFTGNQDSSVTRWQGIRFMNIPTHTDSSNFEYCYFERTYSENGGAIYSDSYPKIMLSNCTLYNNEAKYQGGAIYASDTTLSMENVKFLSNTATGYFDYEYYMDPGFGGAIYCINCQIDMQNLIFENNEAYGEPPYHLSAGAAIYAIDSQFEISNSLFKDNVSSVGAGIYASLSQFVLSNSQIIDNNNYVYADAGIINVSTSRFEIKNSLIANNQSSYGSVINASDSYFEFINSTIAGNSSHGFTGDSNLSLTNTIFWNEGYEIVLTWTTASCDILNSCIDEGENGIFLYQSNTPCNWIEGNIDSDPLFIDPNNGNFRFSEDSPCLNSGTPDTTGLNLLEYDLDGNPRIIEDRIDMGCYEYGTYYNIIPSNELYKNFPNPFNPETTIKFLILQESKVVLTVYNIKGQQVKTLVNNTCEMGINTVIWNGTNDAGSKVGTGVYFYKLDVDSKTIKTKKMLLLK